MLAAVAFLAFSPCMAVAVAGFVAQTVFTSCFAAFASRACAQATMSVGVETIITLLALQARCILMAWTLARLLVAKIRNASTHITLATCANMNAVRRLSKFKEAIAAHIALHAGGVRIALALTCLLIADM